MGLKLQTCTTVGGAHDALMADPAARYLGGGTLLIRQSNEGDTSFSTFVRTTDPALCEIDVGEDEVRLGASVTMARIAACAELAFLAPAARAVGGPAVRNMATVGGNIFAPVPYGDFAVALLALDAHLDLADGRRIAIADFLAERRTTQARAIVRSITFSKPSDESFRFRKVSRVKPKGASVLAIAAVIEEQAGVISKARVAYGCMADRPVRATAVEAALIGRRRKKEDIARAISVATEGSAAVTDAIASSWYRSEILPIHLGRLLLDD